MSDKPIKKNINGMIADKINHFTKRFSICLSPICTEKFGAINHADTIHISDSRPVMNEIVKENPSSEEKPIHSNHTN